MTSTKNVRIRSTGSNSLTTCMNKVRKRKTATTDSGVFRGILTEASQMSSFLSLEPMMNTIPRYSQDK